MCNCKASDTIMIAQPASERPLTSNALAVTAARTASTTNASGIPRIVPIATSSGLVRTTPQFTAKLKSTLAPVCANIDAEVHDLLAELEDTKARLANALDRKAQADTCGEAR